MKKLVFVLAAVAAFSFAIAACSSEKKSNNRPTSTITVEVTPNSIGTIDASSTTRTLTATVKDNGTEIPNASVSWIVNPSTASGNCDPNPGVSTTFFANMSFTGNSGQGSIVASYSDGTKSDPVSFSIGVPMIVVDSIELTASTTSVIYPNNVTFTATAKDTSNAAISGASISWSVNPSSMGVVSSTSSASGDSVTFTPASSGSGVVRVTASCTYGGVTKTASQDITVVSTVSVVNKRMVYSDLGLGPNILSNAPGDNNFGYWSGGSGVASMVQVSGGCDDPAGYDPATCQKLVYNGFGWAGWYMVYAVNSLTNLIPQDLSGYSKLVMWMKTDTAGGKVAIECKNTNDIIIKNTTGVTPGWPILTASWQKYEMNITSINSVPIAVPINIVFEADEGMPAATIYIDYIYFE